jgi:hypothetical protein
VSRVEQGSLIVNARRFACPDVSFLEQSLSLTSLGPSSAAFRVRAVPGARSDGSEPASAVEVVKPVPHLLGQGKIQRKFNLNLDFNLFDGVFDTLLRITVFTSCGYESVDL